MIAGMAVLVKAGDSDNQAYARKVRMDVQQSKSVMIVCRFILSTRKPHCKEAGKHCASVLSEERAYERVKNDGSDHEI